MNDRPTARVARFSSQYHRPSHARAQQQRQRTPRKFSVIANPTAYPEEPTDIPLHTMDSYPEENYDDVSDSGNFFSRTFKSFRKSFGRSTRRLRGGRQTRASLGDDDITYPASNEYYSENGLEQLESTSESRTGTPNSVFEDSFHPRIQRINSIVPEDESDQCAVLSKWIVSFVLFAAILTFATFSKVCFVAIASKYNDSLVVPSNDTGSVYEKSLQENSITFIQLVVILMTPQLFTAVRMFFGGIIGKSSKTYPWPSTFAIIIVSNVCILLGIYIYVPISMNLTIAPMYLMHNQV